MREHASDVTANILVVDDDAGTRTALVELLRGEGHAVRSAADGFKALGQLDDWAVDLVITDVNMPGMDGIELMRRLRERSGAVGIIVMTAHGTLASAVSAMQQGADDYFTKPVEFAELLVVVNRTLASCRLERENSRLRTELEGEHVAPGIEWVGRSRSARELLGLARQVADSHASVLITGASGTGKELVARVLHAWSPRRTGPFVAVHCAGAATDGLARLLFGGEADGVHVAGAVQRARGGVLFLDEIGELPPPLQLELLQVLQTDTDGHDAPGSDVRVIAATVRDLHDEVREGRFRDDLFYRLDVVTLRTPTLAQRRDDIPALAMHFLAKHTKLAGKRIHGFSDRALRVLLAADWPGNVRELDGCIQHATLVCTGAEIEPRHLPREIMQHGRSSDEMPPIPGTSLAELERYAILKTLEQVRGSTSKAAEILGISPRKIQYRLAEYRGDAAADSAHPD
jgi:DNA-binding NtrC family response regulator